MAIEEAGSIWNWVVPLNTLFIAATGIATWLWTRGGNAAVLKAQVDGYKAQLEASNTRADKAESANSDLLDKLHTHMLSDAAAFARLEAIATEASRVSVAAEVRLTASLDNLGKRIDSMSERFDQFLQNQATLIKSINLGNEHR